MHAAILPGLLLFLIVSGHPAVQKEPATAHNSNLTYNIYSPAGPPDFEMTPLYSSSQLDLELCLGMAITAASGQALHKDWESPLYSRTHTWVGGRGILLVAQSTGPQNMESRFFLWALIRMMDSMVQDNRCNSTAADLTWRGQPVGRLTIFRRRSTEHLEAPDSPKTISIPESTATRVGFDRTSLVHVEFFGREYQRSEVNMGTLAALIGVAQRVHGNPVSFLGSWDESPYTVYPIWFTKQRPSQLSKAMLVHGIMAAVNYQAERTDYRCLKGTLQKNEKDIAEGGFAVYPRHRVPGGNSDTA